MTVSATSSTSDLDARSVTDALAANTAEPVRHLPDPHDPREHLWLLEITEDHSRWWDLISAVAFYAADAFAAARFEPTHIGFRLASRERLDLDDEVGPVRDAD